MIAWDGAPGSSNRIIRGVVWSLALSLRGAYLWVRREAVVWWGLVDSHESSPTSTICVKGSP